MRSYSTPESAHRGEVTKLAIVEVFVSVALYFFWTGILEFSWPSLSFIVAAAPFMLLRTERSADWALGHWQRWSESDERMVHAHSSGHDC